MRKIKFKKIPKKSDIKRYFGRGILAALIATSAINITPNRVQASDLSNVKTQKDITDYDSENLQNESDLSIIRDTNKIAGSVMNCTFSKDNNTVEETKKTKSFYDLEEAIKYARENNYSNIDVFINHSFYISKNLDITGLNLKITGNYRSDKRTELYIFDDGEIENGEASAVFISKGNNNEETVLSLNTLRTSGKTPILKNLGTGKTTEAYTDFEAESIYSNSENTYFNSCKADRVVVPNAKNCHIKYGDFEEIDISSINNAKIVIDSARADSIKADYSCVEEKESQKINSRFNSIACEARKMTVDGYKTVDINSSRYSNIIEVSNSDNVCFSDLQGKEIAVKANNNGQVTMYGSHINSLDASNGKILRCSSSSLEDKTVCSGIGKTFFNHLTTKELTIEESSTGIVDYSTIGILNGRNLNNLLTHGSTIESANIENVGNTRFVRSSFSPNITTYEGEKLGNDESNIVVNNSTVKCFQCTFDGTNVSLTDVNGNKYEMVIFDNCLTVEPVKTETPDGKVRAKFMHPGDLPVYCTILGFIDKEGNILPNELGSTEFSEKEEDFKSFDLVS